MVHCGFAWDIWFGLLQTVSMQSLSPQLGAWVRHFLKDGVIEPARLLLVWQEKAWTLCHFRSRNHCVFNRVSPNLNSTLSLASDKLRLGGFVGAEVFLSWLVCCPDEWITGQRSMLCFSRWFCNLRNQGASVWGCMGFFAPFGLLNIGLVCNVQLSCVF